jgi:hypothetical protein
MAGQRQTPRRMVAGHAARVANDATGSRHEQLPTAHKEQVGWSARMSVRPLGIGAVGQAGRACLGRGNEYSRLSKSPELRPISGTND